MGMSTHAIGFRPPDKTWKKMKAVYDACVAADTDVPENVMAFFNHEDPDEAGVVVEIEDTDACKEWSDETSEGFEIDVTKLPAGLTVIRVYNSY